MPDNKSSNQVLRELINATGLVFPLLQMLLHGELQEQKQLTQDHTDTLLHLTQQRNGFPPIHWYIQHTGKQQ